MNYSCILLSAGKGIRFGKDIPKQYLMLAGKPMIVHILERINKIDDIKEVIVVCGEEYVKTIETYVANYRINKKIKCVLGGKTRQESVYNGVKECSFDNVILHESARPLVSVQDFMTLINCDKQNVTYTYSIPYTVLKKDLKDNISGILDRNELVNVQLPQKFAKDDLLFSHEQAKKENRVFTEDASVVYYYTKKPVYCLNGKSYNIKITEYSDLLYGETLLHEEIFKENY